MGDDFFATIQFLELQKIHGVGKTILLSKHRIENKDVYPKGPWNLRGKKNIEIFKNLYPHIELEEDRQETLFLKEGKLKRFGGRAKPEKLLWGESLYKEQRAKVNLKNIFSFPGHLQEEDLIHQNVVRDKVVGIEKIQATAKNTYHLSLASGDNIGCEKLYWGAPPWEFLSLYSPKEQLKESFVTCCQNPRMPLSLSMDLEFQKPVTDHTETLFIPLSYTYDWGHFIGEFFMEKGVQKGVFLAFVNPEDDNEEGVTRKIHIFKRNIDKIFPTFKSSLAQESITLKEESARLDINDKILSQAENYPPNLFFIGHNGGIRDFKKRKSTVGKDLGKASHLLRGLLGLEIIQDHGY